MLANQGKDGNKLRLTILPLTSCVWVRAELQTFLPGIPSNTNYSLFYLLNPEGPKLLNYPDSSPSALNHAISLGGVPIFFHRKRDVWPCILLLRDDHNYIMTEFAEVAFLRRSQNYPKSFQNLY